MLLSQVRQGFDEMTPPQMYRFGVCSGGTRGSVTGSPESVKLDFQELTAFERVGDRYRHLGVTFSEAIALEPSNPTFQPRAGSLVLMPLADRRSITVDFCHPVRQLEAYVSGARSVTLTAFDRDGKPLCLIGCSCQGADPDRMLPRQQLKLDIEGIAKVMFHSNAPFILEQLSWERHQTQC